MEIKAAVEDIVHVDMFLYDIDFLDRCMIGDLARRNVRKYSNTSRLLRYNSHICYISNINIFFKTYGFPSYELFIRRAYDVKHHLTTCRRRVRHVFLKNVYPLRETLVDKLDLIGVPYTDNQKLLKYIINFDFDSICFHEDKIVRYRYSNLDWQTSSNICVFFLELDWRTIFLLFQYNRFSWVIC